MDEQVMRFHQGALFTGRLSTLGFWMLILGVILFIGSIPAGDWMLSLSALILTAFGVEFARNVCGVIIDKKKGTVQSYSQILGMRRGPIVSLNEFSEVVLRKHRSTQKSNGYYSAHDTRGGMGGLKTTSSLELELWKKDGSQCLFLEEFETRQQAQARLDEVARWLEFPGRNQLQDTEDKLQERRANRDPRSVKGRRR